MRAVAVIGLGVVCAVTVAVPPASAAQKVGCPAASKWDQVSLEVAAQRILAEATTDYETVGEVVAYLDAKYDKNGNDSMCIDRRPDGNPSSDVIYFYLRDDNSNGAS